MSYRHLATMSQPICPWAKMEATIQLIILRPFSTRSGSSLAQDMACCLMAPSHYLSQCWLIINGFLGPHLRMISQEVHKLSTHKISFKNTHVKLIPHLSRAKELTQWGREKMAAIFQTTFSDAFSSMKMNDIGLKFHWNLFLRFQLTKFQHWFR